MIALKLFVLLNVGLLEACSTHNGGIYSFSFLKADESLKIVLINHINFALFISSEYTDRDSTKTCTNVIDTPIRNRNGDGLCWGAATKKCSEEETCKMFIAKAIPQKLLWVIDNPDYVCYLCAEGSEEKPNTDPKISLYKKQYCKLQC